MKKPDPASDIPVHCANAKIVDWSTLKPHPRNPNRHPSEQIALLAKNIRALGWRHPVIVSKLSGYIVAGHARIEAAKLLNINAVPVDYQPFASTEEETAYLIADNRIAELAERDNAILKDLLQELDTGANDMDLTGYTEQALETLMTQFHVEDESKPKDELTSSDVQEDNPKLAAFIDRREKSKLRGKDKGEVNFWLCMVFQSHAQKIQFLKSYPNLETVYGMYCDGEAFAKSVNNPVDPNTQKPIGVSVDKQLSGMVMP